MTKPSRSSSPEDASCCPHTYFVTTRTAGGRSLFQTERMASLFIEVLRSNMRARRFSIHEFAVMPNHVHILFTVPGGMSIEKAMQLIKGGFSFRAKRELGFQGEVWQRGFSDVGIRDDASFQHHRNYIENNPVKSGLVKFADEYLFGSAFLKKQKRAGAEARTSLSALDGTTEVVP